MKYRVWHIPQIPGKPFHVATPDLATAVKIQEVLASYDLFQLREGIKPDFSNASGIEQFNELLPERDEWEEVDETELEPHRVFWGRLDRKETRCTS